MRRDVSIEWHGHGHGTAATPREALVHVEPPAAGDPAGTVVVTIDGARRVVDAVQVRPGTWSVIMDGRVYVVDLERRPSGTSGRGGPATMRGTVGLIDVSLTVEDAQRGRLRKLAQRSTVAAGSGERILAPIAGKIVKVLVAMGDTVTPGQAVIVVEAMKMENEITATRGGVVTQLGKGAGAAVDTGELLLQLT